MAVNISISDEQAANNWKQEVMLINEEYRDAMDEAGKSLESTQEFADGTMVDEFVNLGTNLMHAGQAVFQAVNEISTVVNTVMGAVTNLSGTVSGVVKTVASIFGG